MTKYLVYLAKSFTVAIEIDASSTENARKQIKKYGIPEAISDFPAVGEKATSWIVKVEKAE